MRRKKSRLTKVPMVHTALRIPRREHTRLIPAAAKLEISVSEFLRSAIKEKTDRVLEEKLSA